MMNDERRKHIKSAIVLLSQAKEILDLVREEEDEAMEAMPENLHGSERYELMEQASCELDTAVDTIDTVIDDIGEI
jgi:hypothetical protein